MIINELKNLGKESIHISSFDDILKYLKDRVEDNDIILTLGAGYVTKLSNMLTKKEFN